ncbi:MAG TPA: hypothetical protein VMW35_22865 [Myxococcota bacterium]|jgi:hypothetical protein|nr:hypothetical protein [Myxococcota bacterium]
MALGGSRRLARIGLAGLLVAIAAAYFFSNPYWYGDSVWYALDVASGRLPLDSGHLLWRPLGYATWRILEACGASSDPLDAFRWMSSAATALLCLASYRLALALTASRTQALAAAAVVALSKMCLAYGGSGSSYTAAMAMTTLALGLVATPREGGWRARQGAASCLALAAGWTAWGTAVLVLPGLFVAAAVGSAGGWPRRVLHAGLLCGVATALVLAIAFVAYAGFLPDGSNATFLEWLRAASHGRAMGLSSLGMARAAYGLLVSFVHLGSVGTVLKDALLGGVPTLEGVGAMLLVAILFGVALVPFVSLAWPKPVERSEGVAPLAVAALALATLLPVAGFAISWKGSDVERFSLAVPMLAIAGVDGLARLRLPTKRALLDPAKRGFALAAVLGLVNVGTYLAPSLATQGGVATAVGRVAAEHLPAGSTIVVAGNELFGEVMGPAFYHHHITVFSVTFDVIDHGAAGYEERLRATLDKTLARGGRIAVLSDLVGRPTPGGIGLNLREHPIPSLEQLEAIFAPWHPEESWQVDRFTFVRIRPPDDRPPSSERE